MSEDFSIAMIASLVVAFANFFLWLAAFLMGWGLQLEMYFFGFSSGGLAVALVVFIMHAFTRKAEDKEGEKR